MKKIISIILTIITFAALGQDVEQLLKVHKNDPLEITGSLGVQTGGAESFGVKSQRPPFYWSARANLNFKFFGVVDAPLSLSYSPQGSNFDYPYNRQLPFNQIGISPRYKGLTVHLGYRSMNFSSYSLSGSSFNGVGVEWAPQKQKFELSAMYGRFARATNDTTLLEQTGVSLFNRAGFAAKMKYKMKKGAVGFHLFKAKDNPESALLPITGLEATTPRDNLVTGLVFNQSILKKIRLNFEVVRSAYTLNSFALEENLSDEARIVKSIGFKANESTIYSSVIDAGLSYPNKVVDLSLQYKRIGSDYFTLGNPFFNNDLEVSSVGLGRRFFKNKLSINSQIGVQRNNLDNSQLDKTQRLALSLNANLSAHKRWNIGGNYANYSTNTTQIKINELDSLAFFQVSENASLNNTVSLGAKMKQQVSLMLSNQLIRSDKGVSSTVQNASLSFAGNIEKAGLKPQISLNYLRNELKETSSITDGIGATAGMSKGFFKNTLNVRIAYNEMRYFENGTSSNDTRGIRFNTSYKLKKAHDFSGGINWLARKVVTTGKSSELQFNIGYGYSFGKKEIFKKKAEPLTPSSDVPWENQPNLENNEK